jgi:hypothetical protein
MESCVLLDGHGEGATNAIAVSLGPLGLCSLLEQRALGDAYDEGSSRAASVHCLRH